MFFETGFERATSLSDVNFVAVWAGESVYTVCLEFILSTIGVLK